MKNTRGHTKETLSELPSSWRTPLVLSQSGSQRTRLRVNPIFKSDKENSAQRKSDNVYCKRCECISSVELQASQRTQSTQSERTRRRRRFPWRFTCPRPRQGDSITCSKYFFIISTHHGAPIAWLSSEYYSMSRLKDPVLKCVLLCGHIWATAAQYNCILHLWVCVWLGGKVSIKAIVDS